MGNKAATLNTDELEFLVNNTGFSKRKIKQWYAGFMRDCPDGQLTREMFLDVYSQIFPEGAPEKFCEHVFRSFDKDNSGTIEFREFLLAINITLRGEPKAKLNWVFEMYDIDGNGTIEKSEMLEIINAIYEMLGSKETKEAIEDQTPEERTQKIFVQMDTNNDGVLSKDEFINGCLMDHILYHILTGTNGDE